MDERTTAVLDERARRLAIPLREEGRASQNLLAFVVGDARFAVPMPGVSMARERVRVEPLPGVPPWIAGVAGIRGRVMPAVWVDRFLGLDASAAARPEGHVHAVVLRFGNVETAILATAIESVLAIAKDDLEPLPDGADVNVRTSAIGTVRGRLVIDPARLVAQMTAAVRGRPAAVSNDRALQPE